MEPDATATEQELLDCIATAADLLRSQQINYALIGGMATAFRGQPRTTEDIDFLLQVPQLRLPGLLADLAARGFACDMTTTIREWTQEHMTTLSYRGVRIDWLKPVLPMYQHVLDRATDETRLGRTVRVAPVEGLILMKLLADRPQDQIDIANLVAIHRNTLDLPWIEAEWATVAPADDPRMVRLRELVARPVTPSS
jgi:hypothetical protein